MGNSLFYLFVFLSALFFIALVCISYVYTKENKRLQKLVVDLKDKIHHKNLIINELEQKRHSDKNTIQSMSQRITECHKQGRIPGKKKVSNELSDTFLAALGLFTGSICLLALCDD